MLESLPSYLHQIPALQGLSNDGGHGGTDAAKDHQVFGAVADGVEEGPQPLGVVTLQRGREAESERENDGHRSGAGRKTFITAGFRRLTLQSDHDIFIPLLMLFLGFLNYPQMLRQGRATTKMQMFQP